MRIRVPLLMASLVFLLSSSSVADDNSTATSVTFPLPSDCPTRCGNISFDYPFGVGHGCFRPGFELTCNTASNPPMLLLGNSSSNMEIVANISAIYGDPKVEVKTPVAIMNIDDEFAYTSWTAPANASYFFTSKDTQLSVVGCSAVGSLVDLTTNQTLVSCRTDEMSTCQCQAALTNHSQLFLQAYGIRLSRANAVNSTIVKAMISDEAAEASASLNWHISGPNSCDEAKKERSSYACLSDYSECEKDYATSSGYFCRCPEAPYKGNAYIPDGCDDPSLRVVPSANCTTKCGDVSIPFPFGIEEGCYRHDSFALRCNQTLDPPILFFRAFTLVLVIHNIMVEKGLQIELGSTKELNVTSWIWQLDYGYLAYSQERITYNWAVESLSCGMATLKSSRFACRSNNSKCVDTDLTESNRTGYCCACLDGFEGNPYISDGCTDIDECAKSHVYPCFGLCVNTIGNYSCTCPTGTHGDPTKRSCIDNKNKGLVLGIVVGVCIGFGTLFLAIASIFAIRKWKKISQTQIRKRHFHQNRGLLLQQLIASEEDNVEKVKIFSLEELEIATNNFDTSRILGQGGHGIVYKGILSDQRVVAIKRSKIIMTREIDEFINEVILLSKINHRNVVKIFGCCLETEVPLLVYEFISNGTLFDHLHSPNLKATLSWRDRLRIATEAAGALAYLHSAASISIFHRDMKSSNILLDEYNTGKISDFGASRFIRLDQTHKFTVIQGTFGYLDPEYYQTSKLTEKSDVYSFGVILLELLTGQKPVSSAQNDEEGNLVMRFLRALRENQQFELIETRVLEEGSREELIKVSKLADMCLKLKGCERPTMREVEVQLRFLR